MTNAIEDYIKLAEGATEGPWYLSVVDMQSATSHSIANIYGVPPQPTEDGRGQTWVHIGAKKPCFDVSPDEQYANAELMTVSRTLGPAMAKALIEAEEALKMSSGTGTHSATRIVVDQALAAIQRVKEGV